MMSHRYLVAGGNLCVAVKKSCRKFWWFAENYYLCSELRRGTAATEREECMNIEEKIRELFLQLGRTKKVEFISDNIDYASDRAIVRHVGSYICDILEDLWDEGEINGVVEFLKRKGYKVEGHETA